MSTVLFSGCQSFDLLLVVEFTKVAYISTHHFVDILFFWKLKKCDSFGEKKCRQNNEFRETVDIFRARIYSL